MTPEQLAAIRERESKATPGPWRCSDSEVVSVCSVDGDICDVGLEDDDGVFDDSRFIAASRTDIPALLAHIAAQAERIVSVSRELADTYKELAKADDIAEGLQAIVMLYRYGDDPDKYRNDAERINAVQAIIEAKKTDADRERDSLINEILGG